MAKEMPGLAYRVETEQAVIGHPPRVVWEEEPLADVTADEYLGFGTGRGVGQRGRPAQDRGEERSFLEDLLAHQPNGVPAKFIEREARAAGLNWKAVTKAAAEVGVNKKKQRADIKAGQVSKWFWGFGDDWQPPPASIEDARNSGPSPPPAPEHPDTGRLREEPQEEADFLEEACKEAYRASSTVGSDAGCLRDEELRNPTTSPKKPEIFKTEILREIEVGTGNSIEEAWNPGVLAEANLKPQKIYFPGSGEPSGSVWNDPVTFFTLMRSRGLTWPQVLSWLRAPPTVGFFEVPVSERRRAVRYLERLPAVELRIEK